MSQPSLQSRAVRANGDVYHPPHTKNSFRSPRRIWILLMSSRSNFHRPYPLYLLSPAHYPPKCMRTTDQARGIWIHWRDRMRVWDMVLAPQIKVRAYIRTFPCQSTNSSKPGHHLLRIITLHRKNVLWRIPSSRLVWVKAAGSLVLLHRLLPNLRRTRPYCPDLPLPPPSLCLDGPRHPR